MRKIKKIRIAHLVTELVPDGKEHSIIKLCNNLNPNLFASEIFVFRDFLKDSFTEIKGLKVITLNARNGNDILLPFRLSRIFKKHYIDIVHTHSWGTLLEGIVGAKLAKIPIIIHNEHGTFPKETHRRIIQRILWQWPNRFLAVSDGLRKMLSESIHFPIDRIDVIFNGVDEQKFFPSAKLRSQFRNEFHFSEEEFLVGIIGRLEPVKNHRMFLKALNFLKNQNQDVQGIIVGTGELEDQLKEQVAEQGMSKYVHFLGHQSNINLVLNGIDVFVLTSFSEGCSNVILEAMQCGKAIITTNVGGNPDLIENNRNGFLIESNNYKELAQKLLIMKKNPQLRKKLGSNAQREVQKKFSLQKMIKDYENVYIQEYKNKFSYKLFMETRA